MRKVRGMVDLIHLLLGAEPELLCKLGIVRLAFLEVAVVVPSVAQEKRMGKQLIEL